MSNGTLIPAEGGCFKGNIATLAHHFFIKLEPNPQHRRDNPDSPKFTVLTPVRHQGAEVTPLRIGAAWEREIQRGPKAGEKMLSITVDDPMLPAPITVAGFANEGGGYDLVWRRPRQVSEPRPDPGRSSSSGGAAPLDDEIPF